MFRVNHNFEMLNMYIKIKNNKKTLDSELQSLSKWLKKEHNLIRQFYFPPLYGNICRLNFVTLPLTICALVIPAWNRIGGLAASSFAM